MTYAGVPGVVETREALGETTLVVDPARLVEACTFLRDQHGFNFLCDIAATGSQGLARVPAPKPKRFSVSYQLLRVGEAPTRVRVQVWLDDGESVSSVLRVWPAADWFEREAWDMMGIAFEGHPNLVRILMTEDWEGHPLRKDYPLGGEPVRFSDED
jgi:NADH-quinone oxidoreductase subunit C